jgi:molecular chaperone DnaK
MIAEAERYAEADRKRREEADRLNAADATCYQAERMLADHGEKLASDLRSRIESALRETREALAKRDATLATERAEALKHILQEAGSTLYAQVQAGPERGPGVGAAGEARPTGSGPRGRVVEAEYKEASQG